MMFQLEVTGSRFDSLVDTGEAVVQLDFPRGSVELVRVEMGGVVLHTTGRNDMRELTRVAGFDVSEHNVLLKQCELAIPHPSAADLMVALYEPGDQKSLLRSDGEAVILSRAWKASAAPAGDGFEYSIGTVLDWPRGNCELDIVGHGVTMLVFDSSSILKLDGSHDGSSAPKLGRSAK